MPQNALTLDDLGSSEDFTDPCISHKLAIVHDKSEDRQCPALLLMMVMPSLALLLFILDVLRVQKEFVGSRVQTAEETVDQRLGHFRPEVERWIEHLPRHRIPTRIFLLREY